MRKNLGVHVPQAFATLQLTRNLAQGVTDARRLACELDGVRVSQVLALAGHASLQQAPRQPADAAHGKRGNAGEHSGPAAPTVGRSHQRASEIEHHLQSEHHPDQAHVQARIAVQDVRELVGNDALQFVPVQAIERAACHGNHAVLLVPAGGQRIDGLLGLEHEHARRLQATGDRHLVDDVAQAALARSLRLGNLAPA